MPRMMTQPERIEYMLDTLGITAYRFAKECHLTEATVSRWRSDACKISQSCARQIEDRFPQFSTPWIMGETRSILSSTTGVSNEERREVARAKWLHIVTARHLRKARRTIRELREEVGRLQMFCDEKNAVICGYRGQIGLDNPFAHVPDHYLGDGFVTCDRSIESASAQRCIGERSKLQYWYWANAFKYVWRMWSKEDPEKDALKAIDCLEKAAGLGMLVPAEEREDG